MEDYLKYELEENNHVVTEIIEIIKEKEDELIIQFIAENTELCEEHRIPKNRIREVFDFYETYKHHDQDTLEIVKNYINQLIDNYQRKGANENTIKVDEAIMHLFNLKKAIIKSIKGLNAEGE